MKKFMKCKSIFIKLLMCVFSIIFVLMLYILFNDFLQYRKNEEITKELISDVIDKNEETQESKIDWKKLQEINNDVIGWIEIKGTKINYPILQDNSNLYYLRHNYNKEYSLSGSIFTTNKNPFEDEETTIYGHNMKNKSMFSLLGKYINEDFLYAHQHFKIYTPYGNYEAAVFSAYSIAFETENSNIKQLYINERIKYYQKASKCKVSNVEISNKIIKLSTCSYINAKYTPTEQRYYIVASLTHIE